jgi:hypothetical protein
MSVSTRSPGDFGRLQVTAFGLAEHLLNGGRGKLIIGGGADGPPLVLSCGIGVEQLHGGMTDTLDQR